MLAVGQIVVANVPLDISEDSRWEAGAMCEVVQVRDGGDVEIEGPDRVVGSFAATDVCCDPACNGCECWFCLKFPT